MYNPNAPRPIEVFHLSDSANAAIPEDIREQFHCDDQGRVLFFSSPPLDVIPSVQQKLGHSLKYLAAKEERRKLVEAKKRKENHKQERQEGSVKRQRADEETALAAHVDTLTAKAVGSLTSQITDGTDQLYEILYQDKAGSMRRADTRAHERRILGEHGSQEETLRILAHSKEATFVSLKGSAMYLDDIGRKA